MLTGMQVAPFPVLLNQYIYTQEIHSHQNLNHKARDRL
jgi:hypothetical protein